MSTACASDPIAQFQQWLRDGAECGLKEPTAMALATADAAGRPDVRMLLLKGVDERGFVFFTNLESSKAADLRANPHAALCFYWMPLGRQVRVRGAVEPVSDAEADAYFATRARLSQLGAWASRQSRPMNGYYELETEVAKVALRFPFGDIPRPPHWSGYRLVPDEIEFWTEKPFRRHERVLHTRTAGGWQPQWLFP